MLLPENMYEWRDIKRTHSLKLAINKIGPKKLSSTHELELGEESSTISDCEKLGTIAELSSEGSEQDQSASRSHGQAEEYNAYILKVKEEMRGSLVGIVSPIRRLKKEKVAKMQKRSYQVVKERIKKVMTS